MFNKDSDGKIKSNFRGNLDESQQQNNNTQTKNIKFNNRYVMIPVFTGLIGGLYYLIKKDYISTNLNFIKIW
jgi:hypothetical protein